MNGCNLECALIKSKVMMIMQLTMGYSALNYKSLLKCYYVAPEFHLLYYEKKSLLQTQHQKHSSTFK